MDNDRSKFSIEFDSKAHQIDAAAYGLVLVNTVIIVDEITNELEGFGKFKISVSAERKGSYIVDITMQAGAVLGITSSMLTPDNVIAAKAFASKVVSHLGKVLDLMKKLGGEPPKQISQQGDKTIIVTGDNNTITVDNSITNLVFDNSKVQDATSKIFSRISDEPEIDGIKIFNEKKQEVFDSTKADFLKLTTKLSRSGPKERKRVVRATLTPVRQSFDPKLKSDFIYAGNRITVDIPDENFWRSIEADEPFAKGDKLITKLEIQERFNESLKTYERKGYKIVEVIEHRPTPQQNQLFEESREIKKKTRPPKRKAF